MKSKYKGILFIIISAFSFACMNVFVRMSGDLPVIQKAFFRNLIAFFVACGILMKNREKIVFPKGRGWIDLMARPFFGRQVYLQTFMPLTTLW